MDIHIFFDRLWQDYVRIAPQALAIRALFEQTDAEVINDHVAFRTFSDTLIDLQSLQPLILEMGYRIQEHYEFIEKKLHACSYIHPDTRVPKIFMSQLQRHKLSQSAQKILARYCEQITLDALTTELFWSGRHWDMPTLGDYQTLLQESEYAAWLLVIGLRVNHFTVNINSLQSTNSIDEVLRRVEDAGYPINCSGGRVKGTKAELLEQGATVADRMTVSFAGGEQRQIPTCFYEFALRHVDKMGELYQGFVAANADKIFESTASGGQFT